MRGQGWQRILTGAIPLGVPHDQLRETAPRSAGEKLELPDFPAAPVA